MRSRFIFFLVLFCFFFCFVSLIDIYYENIKDSTTTPKVGWWAYIYYCMYKYIPNEINGRHPIAIREKKQLLFQTQNIYK